MMVLLRGLEEDVAESRQADSTCALGLDEVMARS
jgi:hypothetical protein